MMMGAEPMSKSWPNLFIAVWCESRPQMRVHIYELMTANIEVHTVEVIRDYLHPLVYIKVVESF